MDSRYRFLTLGIPLAHSMPSRDVNAATQLAEAIWRRDKIICSALADPYLVIKHILLSFL